MLQLLRTTDAAWFEAVAGKLDEFLIDHAACERKASATGMSFVVRYPDRAALLEPMVELAREELEHFARLLAVLRARGLRPGADERDPYVAGMLAAVRTGRDERLLDRLLVGGIVEARGCERFAILAERLADPALRELYAELAGAEARHRALFFRLARHYFSEREIAARTGELLALEAELIERLPIRARLH